MGKSVLQFNYELNNRPEWVRIPLEGMLSLLPTAVSLQPETAMQLANKT